MIFLRLLFLSSLLLITTSLARRGFSLFPCPFISSRIILINIHLSVILNKIFFARGTNNLFCCNVEDCRLCFFECRAVREQVYEKQKLLVEKIIIKQTADNFLFIFIRYQFIHRRVIFSAYILSMQTLN